MTPPTRRKIYRLVARARAGRITAEQFRAALDRMETEAFERTDRKVLVNGKLRRLAEI